MPESDPASLTPPEPANSTRPWTILGRLSRALREQNWFAVVLELVIVVLGVLIAFQVTSWGQGRADRAKEQTYLRQLTADLSETERILADREARMDRTTHYALSRLVLAYGTPDSTPRDSLIAWLAMSGYVARPRPILGTAEALVASGDIRLIRNDSLRAAILRYLDGSRESSKDQEYFWERALDEYRSTMRRFDAAAISEEAFDLRRADVLSLFDPDADTTGRAASSDWRPPRSADVDALMTDEDAFNDVFLFAVSVSRLSFFRNAFSQNVRSLREQVEAELNR